MTAGPLCPNESFSHQSLCVIPDLGGQTEAVGKDKSARPVSTDVTNDSGADTRAPMEPGIRPAGERVLSMWSRRDVIARSDFCPLPLLQTPYPSTRERVLHKAPGLRSS